MISADELSRILQRALEAQAKQHAEDMKARDKQNADNMAKLMDKLIKVKADPSTSVKDHNVRGDKLKPLREQMEIFDGSNESSLSFSDWYSRHSHIFQKGWEEDATDDDDKKKETSLEKTELLLAKMSSQVYKKIAMAVAPEKPSEIEFEKLILFLEAEYGREKNLYARMHKFYFNVRNGQSRLSFFDEANGQFEDIFNNVRSDQWKIYFLLCKADPDKDQALIASVMAKMKDPVDGKNFKFADFRKMVEALELKEGYKFLKPIAAVNEVKYLGFVVSKEGRRPDPAKVDAITRMAAPKNVSELRTFLGMINYFSSLMDMRFRAPLDKLLKKNVKWVWSNDCEEAFGKAKEMLSSGLVVVPFSDQYPLIVVADASQNGIGGHLSLKMSDGIERPVQYVTRNFTDRERSFSMTEKEAHALSFVVKKLHRYIFGRHFILRTDHQALLTVLGPKKNMTGYAAGRLERIATMLGRYDFELQWVPTTKMEVADCLSRLLEERRSLEKEDEFVIAQVQSKMEEEYDLNVILDEEVDVEPEIVMKNLELNMENVKMETENDPILETILYWLKNGWPTKVNEPFNLYSKNKDKLTLDQGIILYDDRVVVPTSFRGKVLKELHKSHPGSSRMRMKARLSVYWPKIDSDITKFVEKCVDCQENQKMPVKTCLEPWPLASKPMDRVHVDFAGLFMGKMFFLLIDACSKFPFIQILKDTTSEETIKACELIFTEHGYPRVLVSDNGPQFKSEKFMKYCEKNQISIFNSPPYHPMSNGQAERFVDTLKKTLKKMEKNNQNIQENLKLFLYEYRSTPNVQLGENKTPAEVFLGRKLRSRLDDLKPPKIMKRRNDMMEYYFNRHHGAKEKYFEKAEQVWILQPMKSPPWIAGQIMERIGEVKYKVKLVDGQTWMRHANQLRHRHATVEPTVDEELELLDFEPGGDGPTPQEMIPPELRAPAEPTPVTPPLSPPMIRSTRPRRDVRPVLGNRLIDQPSYQKLYE